MHWDWVTFCIGICVGLVGGVVLAGVALWVFAKGMSDE